MVLLQKEGLLVIATQCRITQACIWLAFFCQKALSFHGSFAKRGPIRHCRGYVCLGLFRRKSIFWKGFFAKRGPTTCCCPVPWVPWDTGWQQLVGPLFAKRPFQNMSLWQKRPNHIYPRHATWSGKPFKNNYGVATISRYFKMIGLFCKRAL